MVVQFNTLFRALTAQQKENGVTMKLTFSPGRQIGKPMRLL